MAVSAQDVLAAAQVVIDKQAARGITVAAAADQKAAYDTAHAAAVADDASYSAAFDAFVETASSFTKDSVEIP